MAQHGEIDKVTGVSTTGHEWDGIKELNTPLPRWWLWLFYICIVWAIGYYFVYPSWPLVSDYTRGYLGYSQREAALTDAAAGQASRMVIGKGLEAATFEQIKADPKMLEFAMANGKAAFGNNCAPCHGSGATGSPGYPNLQDDDWLWGGTLDAIQQTITVGARSTSPDTRQNVMPAFGRDQMLTADQIDKVADYVLSLSGSGGAATDEGKQIFADNCAACHGEGGIGNQDLGAPKLTDKIWLYSGTKEAIVAQINNPKLGVMPTWGGKLDAVTIKSLAIYVHDLGGGV
ncbi:cytochrome-c oxidase, cbb3-type subunit III [Oryzibacter oryziterrae]|uniref:cytochrome-c oxidase, cbb3-type subunit III n=1 Tax=Oryzibacter oryziterrae TaxID=2766474 RepID=UPI001F0040B8|nr:cytochrome-c oxidase, cbb3-type subunit III [Oryzibacter oryziterrae]